MATSMPPTATSLCTSEMESQVLRCLHLDTAGVREFEASPRHGKKSHGSWRFNPLITDICMKANEREQLSKTKAFDGRNHAKLETKIRFGRNKRLPSLRHSLLNRIELNFDNTIKTLVIITYIWPSLAHWHRKAAVKTLITQWLVINEN